MKLSDWLTVAAIITGADSGSLGAESFRPLQGD